MAAESFVNSEIANNPVVVFSKTYCPYCHMAKETLQAAGAKYALHELDNRGDGSAIQDFLGQLTGERTVPRVFIDGKCVGGGSDVKRLHSEGKLVPLLTKAKAL